MKKIFVIILFVFIGAGVSNIQAQKKQYYNVGWDIGMPVGEFSDYISNTSFRGAYFSGNIFLKESFSLGFKFGYNSYSENIPKQTYQLPSGLAVTAASYNYIVSAPVTVGGYYHFNTGMGIEPYIGLGLGVNYLTEETIVQDLDAFDDQWAFLLNPEIGLRYQFQDSPLAIGIRAGYNYNFNSYKVWGNEYNNLQSLNVGISLSWVIQ